MGSVFAIISTFDTAIVEVSANPERATRYTPPNVPGVYAAENFIGQLKITIDGPPDYLKPSFKVFGTYVFLAGRTLVNSEVGHVWGYPQDLSGIALLNMCDKNNIDGVEKPS